MLQYTVDIYRYCFPGYLTKSRNQTKKLKKEKYEVNTLFYRIIKTP